jgi:hypothetical protein
MRYVFEDYLQFDLEITDSADYFRSCPDAKLSYASEPLGNEPFIWRSQLLLQTDIHRQSINIIKYNQVPVFFETTRPGALFPFDLFAASFYLLSRYEEYLPSVSDRFGRFSARYSLAVREGFLEKPLVNIWSIWLYDALHLIYPSLVKPIRNFTYIATYDIDQAFAFRHRGLLVNMVGMIKSLLSADLHNLRDRLFTLTGRRTDRFDSYDFQFQMQEKFDLWPYYFILAARHRGSHDRNLSLKNKHFKTLLHKLSEHGIIGIHPSFASSENPAKISEEINDLAAVLHRPVEYSRQHYLMLRLPYTYRTLIEHGIKYDFTMGYASRAGFRASVCTPFRFFDLNAGVETSLWVYPLTYMDGTLNDYMQLSKREAEKEVNKLIDEVVEYGGTFVSLWHNSSLSDRGHWRGWRAVYNNTLEYAAIKTEAVRLQQNNAGI